MKPTAGNAKPRRPAQRPARDLQQKQLNLQRRPRPEAERDAETEQRSGFWKWVLIVTLLHAVAISIFYIVQAIMAAEKPAPVMFSLLPPGDVVKGTAGAQSAKKVGLATAAPKHTSAQSPPPTAPQSMPKPLQKSIPPKSELKVEKPTLMTEKPTPKPPVKLPPKKEPKVKVDLSLADGPQTEKPKPSKAKTPVKKQVSKTDANDDSERESNGLSKDEIAAKLGAKSDNEGTHNAKKIGIMGAQNGTHSDFGSFYNLIAEQVHDEWNSPVATAAVQRKPVVGIHVEPSGRIPAESVHLISSSGDPSYDAAAIDTVRHIGMLRERLPDNCPPDISINFDPNP